jgi:hypothetical protein
MPAGHSVKNILQEKEIVCLFDLADPNQKGSTNGCLDRTIVVRFASIDWRDQPATGSFVIST